MMPLAIFCLCSLISTLPDLHVAQLTASAATATSKTNYLKVQLLHIKPFTTPSQALTSDFQRLNILSSSVRRQSTKSPLISGASSGSGQYFVDLHIGTPPQKLRLVADTGSDLIWVKCSACRNDCSDHHTPGSAFLARHSDTFSPVHCFDPMCELVTQPIKERKCRRTQLHSPCWYEYQYGDGSLSSGIFSTETTSLNTSSGKEVSFTGLNFGCGFEVSGPSVSGASFNGANGVIGLGRGPISFSAQLGLKFGNRFSYCLLDYTLSPPPTSYLVIGDNVHINSSAIILPNNNYNLRSTPLITNPFAPTFYYVGITGVSINGVKLPINPSVWGLDDIGNGGTVIDSGTTLSFLPEPAYRVVLSAMLKQVGRLPLLDEPSTGFDLCVNVSGVTSGELGLPKMRFELVGGSVFPPPPRNYFIDTAEDVKCLALQGVSTPGGFGVIGNLMQQGFLFEFDNDRSRLHFTRKGCGER